MTTPPHMMGVTCSDIAGSPYILVIRWHTYRTRVPQNRRPSVSWFVHSGREHDRAISP
jgi:hypothetical protein